MKAILRILVYLPLGVALAYFAVSNRQMTPVSLGPLSEMADLGEANIQAPLFIVVLISMALGVLFGGFASWNAHRSVRRAAKLARAEAAQARAEIETLRAQALASLPAASEGARR